MCVLGSSSQAGSHTDASPLSTELLRYSSKRFLLDIIPEELQEHHKVKPLAPLAPITLRTAPVTTIGRARQHLQPKPAPKKAVDIWADWDDASPAFSSDQTRHSLGRLAKRAATCPAATCASRRPNAQASAPARTHTWEGEWTRALLFAPSGVKRG